jgi:hypothetical protein
MIRIKRNKSRTTIMIDGKPFPFPIRSGSVRVNLDPDEVPSITVTIVADRVVVDDEMGPWAKESLQELTDTLQAEDYPPGLDYVEGKGFTFNGKPVSEAAARTAITMHGQNLRYCAALTDKEAREASADEIRAMSKWDDA